ncbi:hypothetical protein [Sphingomonas psychrotolerans]|uniref:hypothetical protein n=1 Tax=Sphingomonas psychrotolerans TaxID=1327635 RepID=UPI0013051B9C|nr:hypothetical protein [Sphingomonas psychrotolerans]
MILILAVALAPTGCGSPQFTGQGKTMSDADRVSDGIMKTNFSSLDDLKRYMNDSGVGYTLETETDPLLVVQPSRCLVNDRTQLRFSYLRLEGTKGAKVYRYRVYENGSGSLCIEEDFGFKNPYQQ